MHDLALMAANEWAKAQAGNHHDPREFGSRVAQVELFCLQELGKLAKLSTADAPVDAAGEILRSAGLASKEQPTSTPEQRATALELAGCLARRVRHGSVIGGAFALADKFTAGPEYERAVGLILGAGPTPLGEPPFASWSELIEAADALGAWLKTGEQPADPAVLLRAFPSVAAYQ